MRWPWRRFEAFFDRHLRRKAQIDIEHQRALMIAAINANSNYDGDRQVQDEKIKRIEAIESAANEAISRLWDSINKTGASKEREYDPFEDDPLFKSMKRLPPAGPPAMAEQGMGRAMLDAMPATG